MNPNMMQMGTHQQSPQQAQQQQPLENISKVKALVVLLRDILAVSVTNQQCYLSILILIFQACVRAVAVILTQNNQADNGVQ